MRTAKLISFKSTGDLGIQISFPYNKVDVQHMHMLKDRRWHSDQKCWTCTMTTGALKLLTEWGFEMDPRFDNYTKIKPATKIKQGPEIKGLKKTLYPFQQVGVEFIESRGGRALVADEMGLGKTIQALAWLQLHPELRPAVIVVPAVAKLKWVREAQDWMADPKAVALHGTQPGPSTLKKYWENVFREIYVINYDILSSWIPFLQKINPKAVIIDECHYIKNNKAKRTKAVKRLAKGIDHVICLSGTPIKNRPAEIYNGVKLVDPLLLPEPWPFYKKYCGLKHNGFGWDWTGASNTKELHKLLTDNCMIRRLKKEVLPDLPTKTRTFVPMPLDNKTEYRDAELNFIDYLRGKKGEEAVEKAGAAQHLVQVAMLKQLAIQGKIKHCIQWIEDFLEVEDKLVVFCVHRNVAHDLMEHFGDIAVKIVGGMSAQQKEDAYTSFQTSGKIKLFVGNIQAAGVAIDLFAASHVAFLELPQTPGDMVQAEDRLLRIGQENNVTVHFLLAQDTIDEKMAMLLDRKAKVIAAVTDGAEVPQQSMLTELINEYLES